MKQEEPQLYSVSNPDATGTLPAAEAADSPHPMQYVKGCPALLIPTNADWAPTVRDRNAPGVLPERSWTGKIRNSFARKSGKPLRPYPASFARLAPPPSPKGTTYSGFPTFYLPGKSKRITNGFQPRYPAHIMVDHDVSAVDWDRFLMDLQVTGKTRAVDKAIATLVYLPLVPFCGCCCGFFCGWIALSSLQRRYVADVLALVEAYQYRFFQPRGLDVFVACGSTRLTGYFPGDDSYLDAPPVEAGAPAGFSNKVEEHEYLRRVPRNKRKTVLAVRHANKMPGTVRTAMIDPESRAEAKDRKQVIKADQKRLKEERRSHLRQEKHDGIEITKSGKYRIVVQQLSGEPPKPTSDALLHIAELERKWGYQRETVQADDHAAKSKQ